MTAFDRAWDVVKMPARDRRYTVTADDVKRMQELYAQGMSQAAIRRLFVDEGIPVTQGIVHYWVNEASRMAQREKNAKRRYEPGSEENAMRIARDQEKRKENWEEDPEMRLRHEIQSAMDENRSERHTIQGMTMDEARAKIESGELRRPNAKIPEEEL
tara:strand:- start:128 stop:601 length:474 start_codon:yes stop_codon:yes gene_type:complete